MILSYTFPSFEHSIPAGDKHHSFRLDPTRRWRAGLSIQHWMGSPRNPRGNPRKFWENECTAVQSANILRVACASVVPELMGITVKELIILINGKAYVDEETLPIIQNDGLTQAEFFDFFVPKPGAWWLGRCIHWTDNQY